MDQNHNQIEVVTYIVNNRCAIGFQTGGFVFSVAPFFPWRGGGGGLKAPDSEGGGVMGGVSCEEFGVDKGGGGVDVVHNQGVGGGGFMVW